MNLKGKQFKLHDPSWGEVLCYVIHENSEGQWNGGWEVLRSNPLLQPILSLFSRVSYPAYQDALHHYALPLIKELGLSPSMCFVKSPDQFLQCSERKTCPTYAKKTCQGNHPKVPMCFMSAVPEPDLEPYMTYIFSLWRQGFYIIIVPDYMT